MGKPVITQRELTECSLCGAWAAGCTCPSCQGEKTVPTPRGLVRILVELSITESGSLVFAGLRSARLPWLEADKELVNRLREQADRSQVSASFGWGILLSRLRELTYDHVAAHLGPSLAGEEAVRRALAVTVRVSSHTPAPPSMPSEGAVLRPMQAALEANGRGLKKLDVDLRELSLLPGGAGPRVRSEEALLLTAVDLLLDEKSLYSAPFSVQVRPGHWHELPALRPPGPCLLRIAESVRDKGQPSIGILLHVLGRSRAVAVPMDAMHLKDLPAPDRRVRLFLDIGSTTTKSLRSSGDGEDTWHWADTSSELERLGRLPPYAKAAFVGDPSRYAEWLDQALPRLDDAVLRSGAYLESLHLAFPSPGVIEKASSDPRLVRTARRHLLCGEVELRAEFEALSAQFIPVLRELRQHESRHEHAHKAEVDAYQRRHAEWKRKAEDTGILAFLERLFDDPGEEPKRPSGAKSLGLLSAALRRASETDLLLLDAGGLSLDAAFVVAGTLDVTRSKGLAHVGGEDVSARMPSLEGKSSQIATMEKARLARLHNRKDPLVREYVEATIEVYAEPLERLVRSAKEAFGGRPFLVVVSGGASRNPFFGELLLDALEQAGLQRSVVDARFVAQAADGARANKLKVPRVDRYLAIAAEEGGGLANEMLCGRFDLVGGMWCEAQDAR